MPPTPVPSPSPSIPLPRLDLRVHPFTHPALSKSSVLTPGLSLQIQGMIRFIISQLYLDPINRGAPNVRSITIYLRPMDGIAYTTGSWIDESDKEVHVSLDYVDKNEKDFRGVLVHELVHCLQTNARSTCPGGLIEGIADFIRLRYGLSPPHWSRGVPTDKDEWDGGYERTGYFLDWICKTYGEDLVKELNEIMREEKWEEAKQTWRGCCSNKSIEELWEEYKEWCKTNK